MAVVVLTRTTEVEMGEMGRLWAYSEGRSSRVTAELEIGYYRKRVLRRTS